MKKILLTALALVYYFGVTAIARADISMTGYQEFFAGSGDQSTQGAVDTSTGTSADKSGFSNGNYTRLIAKASNTLDSGIEVTGTFTIARDTDNGADAGTDGITVDQNDLTFSGGFGTIYFGNSASAGTKMHNRTDTIIPTGEPDGGILGHFYTGGGGNYGAKNEVGYASNYMKVGFMSNNYQGLQVGVSFGPDQRENTANASGQDSEACTAANVTGDACYQDMLDVVVKYSTSFDGGSFSATYGNLTGNTPMVGTTEYNDLESSVITASLTYAGFTLSYMQHEMGDSGEAKSTTDDGDREGTKICGKYVAGNFTVGACRVNTSYNETSQSTDNEQKDNMISAGYNLGGGVNLEAGYITIEQEDNGTKDTDVDIIFSKVSFGF